MRALAYLTVLTAIAAVIADLVVTFALGASFPRGWVVTALLLPLSALYALDVLRRYPKRVRPDRAVCDLCQGTDGRHTDWCSNRAV